ncbi:MAG: GTPase, partial [Pseudobdellovibrio sp.]
QGRILKDGLKVVLAGLPNVGKSSLLNNILLQDKAIVTDIAGTTRDVVEGYTLFNGVKFNISDTAGLRDTADVVENIGVERSKKEIASSDITLFVFDCSDGLKSEDVKILQSLSGQVLVVANKIDKNIKFKPQDIAQKLQDMSLGFSIIDVLGVSALDENTRDIILNSISSIVGLSSFSDDSVISTARQHELSTQALELIEQSVMELKNDLGSEFIAQTLKNALISLQRILGKSYDDQIMDRVFKEFCLGK